MDVHDFHQNLVIGAYQVDFSTYQCAGHAVKNIFLSHEGCVIFDSFRIESAIIVNDTRHPICRVGIEPSGPSGEREISNEPSQGPGPLSS